MRNQQDTQKQGFSTVNVPKIFALTLIPLFLGTIPVFIATIALRVYIKSGTINQLLIGSGIFLFGLGSTISGWIKHLSGGPNLSITIHRTCACISSIVILIGAVLSFFYLVPGRDIGNIRK